MSLIPPGSKLLTPFKSFRSCETSLIPRGLNSLLITHYSFSRAKNILPCRIKLTTHYSPFTRSDKLQCYKLPTATAHYSTPSRILLPGLFKTFVSKLRSYTLCSKVCAILIASVGQATMHKLHMVHNSR